MKDNYYFDNAATTWPKPEPVYRFMDSFFRSHGVNPGRSGSELALEAEQMIFSTRRMLAEFFGFSGDPNRVVFTLNATDSLNMALRGLLQQGDHLVISALEHNAVLRTANHLERDFGVAVSRVAPDANGYIDPAQFESAITPATKAIVLNHASNVAGTVQNIQSVAEIANRHGAAFIVDTAQTAGVLPVDMSCGIDVLTFTGHKGLYGPMGIGGMIVGENINLKPMRFGGTGVDSASPFQPDGYPHALEAGTLSMPGVAGLNAAQQWFAELGEQMQPTDKSHQALCHAALEHIHHTEMAHVERIWNHLATLNKVTTLGNLSDGEHIAVVSFTVEEIAAQQVAEMLDADYHICARAGLQCAPGVHDTFNTTAIGGAVRISPGYFTEQTDVDHLLASLTELLG
jgi:cysteine desulfurase family protein